MRKHLLVGVPGSGKSTHTAMLTRDFDLVRISAGDILRGRPRREGVCDSCGGRLETREDDTPEALTARIEDHRESIAALLDRLRRKAPVFVVDASRNPDTVQEEIRMLLGLPSHRFGRRQGGDQP